MRLAALLLLSVLLVPVAAADHVFSHRLLVTGRVVGSDGVPLAGAPVTLTLVGVDAPSRCFDSREEVTGPQGDFTLCRHAHEMPEGDVSAHVSVQGETVTVAVDKALRKANVLMRLEAPAATVDVGGERAFRRTVAVEGRVFALAAASFEVEGVRVVGEPLAGRIVDVRLQTLDHVLVAREEGRTNDFGDYVVTLDVTDVPEGSEVLVSNGSLQAGAPLDVFLRRANVDVVRPVPSAPIERPGTGDVRVDAPSWGAALGAAACAAVLAARRRAR